MLYGISVLEFARDAGGQAIIEVAGGFGKTATEPGMW